MPNTFCKNVSGIAKYTILTFKLLKPVVVMPALGVVSMGVAICSCIMSRGFVMARRLPINQTGRSENMTYGNATTWANIYNKTCLRTPLSSQVNNGCNAPSACLPQLVLRRCCSCPASSYGHSGQSEHLGLKLRICACFMNFESKSAQTRDFT